MLISTTGITFTRHFCKNELVSTAVFVKFGCHKKSHGACAQSGHCGKQSDQDKKNCCNDDKHFYKSDQEKQPPVQGADILKKTVSSPVVSVAYSISPPVLQGQFLTFLKFKPPIVGNAFQAMLQTFLF